MKLVVKKKGVGYGVNASDVAITDIANLGTLKEGSFLIAFDNGSVIKADGTFTGTAGEKAIIYHKPVGGQVLSSSPIVVGHAGILKPLTNTAPVAKVVTIDLTKGTIAAGMASGVSLVDAKKNINDNSRRKDYTIYTDSATTQAVINAGIKALVETDPNVASAALSTNVLTITFKANTNVFVYGLGAFELVKPTTTAALVYGDALTTEEMIQFAKDCSPFDGNRDSSLDGVIGLFTKDYGVENTTYIVIGIEINRGVFSTGKTDMNRYGAVNYIAIPEGDLAAANEGFMDIIKAAVTGVSADTGATGADAGDN